MRLRIAAYSDDVVLQRVIGRYLNQGVCAAPPFPCGKFVKADAAANDARWRSLRQASLEVMQRAVESLGGLRGRKSVTLMTEGFIHDQDDDAYRGLVGAAQRVNAAIYFVDVRGLQALTESASAAAARDVGLNSPAAGSATAPGPIAGASQTMFQSSMERSQRFMTIGVETMADVKGRVAIDPDSGAVLRTDVKYDFGSDSGDARHQKRARIVTEYARDAKLGVLVPVEMRESYELPWGAEGGSAIVDDVRDSTVNVSIKATARYAGYRRFEVTTDEAFR